MLIYSAVILIFLFFLYLLLFINKQTIYIHDQTHYKKYNDEINLQWNCLRFFFIPPRPIY